LEEKQNADTGDSNTPQGNQPAKEAKAQNTSSEGLGRGPVPQYGRHNKRQFPHREQKTDKLQDSNKAIEPDKPQESGEQQAKAQDTARPEEPPVRIQEKSGNDAVNDTVSSKGSKKAPYNRYRGRSYSDTRDSSIPVYERKKTIFKKISMVIPLLNEEESLRPLAMEIKKVMRGIIAEFEVMFIDDGSTDKSLSVLKEISKSDNRFKYISFRKNYGKSAALHVGFQHVNGDVVITMDADLQDDPNEIPNLIQKLEEGNDLVSGWKQQRHDPFVKRHSSRFFNFITGLMSGVKIHDFNCGLKAYRKEVLKDINVYGELHRYMPVLADWQGYRISEIPVKHHARRFGQTKFGISRFFKGFIDLITVMFTTRYIRRPMHLFGFLGAVSFLIGIVVNGYLSVEWITGKSLSSRPLLFLGMLLIIVGVQFFSVGLLGELMVHNSQNDKEYSIKEKS